MALWGEFVDDSAKPQATASQGTSRGRVLLDLDSERDSDEQYVHKAAKPNVRPTPTDIAGYSSDSSSVSSDQGLAKSYSQHQDLTKAKIVAWVAGTNAFFRSQQKDEVDLTLDEKKRIAGETLDRSPALFLSRYGQHLRPEHLFYFEQFRSDYDVNFYLRELVKPCSKAVVKNRRYQAMQALIDKGEYFSMPEMKQRNPLLFEHLVGQYLTKEERREVEDDKELCSLSTLLMAHMDRDKFSSTRRKVQEAEDQAWNEVEEDNSEDEDESEDEEMKIDPEEKEMLREEFVSTMYASFLEGKDEEFDYEAVDQNAEFDNVELRERDAQDRYFDDDDE